MNNLSRLTWLLVGALFAAAVLAPCLYLGMQWAAGHWGGAALHYLAGHPFTRYFNRVFQLGVLIGITAIIWKKNRNEGARSLETFGLGNDQRLKPLLTGLGLSLFLFALYAAAVFVMGWQRLRPTPALSDGIGGIVVIIGTALGVAVVEEAFFRGYFYGLCRSELGMSRAIRINVLLFAVVHYVRSPQENFAGGIHWNSGFRIFQLTLQSFANPSEIAGGFLVLMLVAWMLCWTVERTGSVYLAIGLHAGWIIILKFNFAWMQHVAPWPTWVLGGGDLRQGVLAMIPLGIEFWALRWWFGKKQ